MKNILVISPHPDDEAIGCGGTIALHLTRGDVVHVIFLTSGEKGGHGKPEDQTIATREQEAKEAASFLKIEQTDFWREPDGNFETSENNIARLLEKINVFKPVVIYVPHINEAHPDHKSAYLLVKHTLKHTDLIIDNLEVFCYELWTPIQQIDLVHDISDYVEIKRESIRAHKSQCEVMDFEEAILGLNRYRGEMHSWPGGDYAEVFMKMDISK